MASTDRTVVEKLRRQQAALAKFGRFAFNESDLLTILTEAARICAASLDVRSARSADTVPLRTIFSSRPGVAGNSGSLVRVVSRADETSPQGRAYKTGEPVIIRDVRTANNLALPDFYPEHGIVSTVDVVISALDGTSYGVLEIDSPDAAPIRST